MSRRDALRWALRALAAAALVLLVVRLGAGPFLAGLARLTLPAVVVALGLTALATLAASWRWSALARAFGVPVTMRAAIPAYYRSQLVNSVLPGGVVGDVERALGGSGERLARVKAVAWDRASGQAVQLTLLAAALGSTASAATLAAAVGAGAVLMVVAAVVLGGRTSEGRLHRWTRTFRADLRVVLSRPAILLPVLAGSAAVALLHAGVLVLAAVMTGTPGDLPRLIPVALVVQTALALPLGFGGLGVREGVAAAAFAAAGLGAAHGVSAGITAGVLALIAVLPGVVPRVHLRRPAVAR